MSLSYSIEFAHERICHEPPPLLLVICSEPLPPAIQLPLVAGEDADDSLKVNQLPSASLICLN
jgi:hypothetical protein